MLEDLCSFKTFYILQTRTYRSELLRQVIDVYKGAAMPDYVSMVQCLIILDDPNAVALVLETLSKGSQEDILMAYQVLFEYYELKLTRCC